MRRTFWMGIIFLYCLASYAADKAAVCQWTRQTLTNTLSIDFNYSPTEATKFSKGLSANAWHAISQFLGDYLAQIRTNRLSIHPIFTQEPEIVDQGVVSGIQFWRVNETIVLPEINLKIAFSVVVIATRDSFFIQSLNMRKLDASDE